MPVRPACARAMSSLQQQGTKQQHAAVWLLGMPEHMQAGTRTSQVSLCTRNVLTAILIGNQAAACRGEGDCMPAYGVAARRKNASTVSDNTYQAYSPASWLILASFGMVCLCLLYQSTATLACGSTMPATGIRTLRRCWQKCIV
jgi:hypothetical protein